MSNDPSGWASFNLTSVFAPAEPAPSLRFVASARRGHHRRRCCGWRREGQRWSSESSSQVGDGRCSWTAMHTGGSSRSRSPVVRRRSRIARSSTEWRRWHENAVICGYCWGHGSRHSWQWCLHSMLVLRHSRGPILSWNRLTTSTRIRGRLLQAAREWCWCRSHGEGYSVKLLPPRKMLSREHLKMYVRWLEDGVSITSMYL